MIEKAKHSTILQSQQLKKTVSKTQNNKLMIIIKLGLIGIALNSSAAFIFYKLFTFHSFISYFLISFVAIADIFLVFLVISNPGIIPKNVNNIEFYEQCYDIPKHNKSNIKCNQILLLTNNTLSKIKYCQVCKLYKPKRTIHCLNCNQCVLQFDHHCQWIGVCVGKNNYILFIFTISILFIAILSILGGCLKCLAASNYFDFNKFVENNFLLISISILGVIFSIALMLLLIYHFSIIFKGFTTNEDLKNIYGGYLYPFKKYNTWTCKKSHFKNYHPVFRKQDIQPLQTQKRVLQ